MIKKFLTLAVVAALFVACGEEKPTPTPNPGGGNTEQPGGNEDEGGNGDEGGNTDGPTFVSKIQIDGDYADWDALAESDYVVSTLPEGECLYPVLKTFKMHADEYYLYILLEYDPRGIYSDVTDEYTPVRNLDIFIDEDNDPATGRYYAWSDCCGYMLQGAFHGVKTPYNPDVNLYVGEDMDPAWAWEDMGIMGGVSAVIPTDVSEDFARFECALLRPMFPFGDAETIGVGIILETEGWSSIGQLPQNAVESVPASVEESVEGDDTTTEEGDDTTTEEEIDPAARPHLLYINLPAMS